MNEQPRSDDTAADSDEQPLPLDHPGEGQTNEDPVEDASEDSFPASDPPSFTGGATS
jgi:hypothetical protein